MGNSHGSTTEAASVAGLVHGMAAQPSRPASRRTAEPAPAPEPGGQDERALPAGTEPDGQGDGGRSAGPKPARERARERRLAERGDRILDALATLIARWGYGKTTVDDVAREAGVAKGTVYLHWPTKGAMLHALIEREEQQWNAIVAERTAADPRGGTLSSLYGQAMALCLENPLLRALFIQDHEALGEWTRSPQSRERAHQRMERLHALLNALRAAGTLRTDLTVGVQAYLLIALSYGILTVDEFLPAEHVPPLEDVVDAYAMVVRRAFEPDLPAGDEAPALARGQAAIADMIRSLGDATTASGRATGAGQDAGATGDEEGNT